MRSLQPLLLAVCLFLGYCTSSVSADPPSKAPRVAIVGGGIGGAAAAYFLRQDNPTWQIELFERDCIGGRVREVTLDGKVLELGASIIHGANMYMLDLTRAMNLTLTEGDDTGAAFSIWDGKDFVMSETGSAVSDLWTIVKRYGVSPLRYKWLSSAAGQKFGGIYKLQQQGTAFATPEQWLQQLGIYNVTQQSAADHMEEKLTQGPLSYGAGLFIEELAGAINRINYNQNNTQLNALAGLVSYLPAADPRVYSISEGNAAVPNKLVQAAQLQGLHVGANVTSIALDRTTGQYTIAVQALAAAAAEATIGGEASVSDEGHSVQPAEASSPHHQQQNQQEYGPFDAVIVAAPLEGSGLVLQGLSPEPKLPPRTYQQTTTSFVTGYVDASFFDRVEIQAGDIFVTNSARTLFTVVAGKGTVSVHAVPERTKFTHCGLGPHTEVHVEDEGQHSRRGLGPQAPDHSLQQGATQQRQGRGEQQEPEQIPLWKVFSSTPLSWHTLRTLFVNGTVVASKTWAAYPRFQPPEKFAPFLLGPGLCYNNALENAASAMEVAAVAAKNCALLVQQHFRQMHLQGSPGHERVTVE